MNKRIKSSSTFYIVLLVASIFSMAFMGMRKSRIYKGYKTELKINENGTFRQLRHDCTYSFIAKGDWNMRGDTIKLNYTKVKWKSGENQATLERSNQLLTGFGDTLYYLGNYGSGLEMGFKMVLEK